MKTCRYISTWSMKLLLHITIIISLLSIVSTLNNNQLDSESTEQQQDDLEMKLSDQIISIMEHYQQEDPVGMPGASKLVPDPMPIPPLKHSFPVATMNFKDMVVNGQSKFKITHMHANIAKMRVEAELRIDALLVIGNYTMATWFTRSAGPFTVKLMNVTVTGIGNLAVERKGQLTIQEIAMDVTFERIDMNFENLGFMGNVFQGIINSVGTFLFDSIKPFILSQANKNMRGEMDKQIEKIPYKFPNSISPFDMAVVEARKMVRARGYDPYKIDDYNHTIGIMDIHLTHTWIYGLSGFYRNGDITIELRNQTVISSFDIGTQRLRGSSHWEIGVIGGMVSRAGTLSFSIEHFKIQASLNQSLDTRQHPILDDLQLDLGNIQVRCNGAGTADYLIELIVNVLPNLLRYQIMDALENPLKIRIQTMLNTTNIDKMVRDKAQTIDDMGKGGFNFQF